MKCAQQHTTDRHTRHTRGTHWHTLANTCTHTTHCRLPSPGTPTAAHQRKKHSVLILIEKLLIFHASSSRGSSRDGSSRGRPRPLLTPTHTHAHSHVYSLICTYRHTQTHTHATASALQLLPSELFVLPILQLCVCCVCVYVCVCESMHMCVFLCC